MSDPIQDTSTLPMPDLSSAPLDNPTPPQAGQDTASAPPQPGIWHRVLTGALQGLAHGGVAGAIVGGVEATSPDQYNVMQRNIQRQQDLKDAQLQDVESNIHFRDAQSAKLVTDAHIDDLRLHALPQELQDEANSRAQSLMSGWQTLGLQPVITAPNHGAGALASLQGLTQSHGAVPRLQIVNTGDTLVGYDLSQLANTPAVLGVVNQYDDIVGKPQLAFPDFQRLPTQSKEQLINQAMNFGTEKPTKASAQGLALQYQNYADTYKARNDGDPAIQKKLDASAAFYAKAAKSYQQADVDLAVNKATAEMPVKVATVKAEAEVKSAGKPVYAVNQDGQTVLTTSEEAQAGGYKAVRTVNQTQIASDTHNTAVLNDVSLKANAVLDSSVALDQGATQKHIISYALGDNGVKIGFGEHLALPADALINDWLKTNDLEKATPLTKAYLISVLSLRESAMGMNRVLTGSARASESQIKALQATIPGYEDSSSTAKQRLASFAQNVEALQSGVPIIPGVQRVKIKAATPGTSGSF